MLWKRKQKSLAFQSAVHLWLWAVGADLNWRMLGNARWLKRASPEASWAEAQSCCFHVCCARWGSSLQQTSQWLKRNYSTCKTCTKRGWYTCHQCLMHAWFYNIHQAVNRPSGQLLTMEELFLLLSFSGVQKGYQIPKFHLWFIDNRRSMFLLCCSILLQLLSSLHHLFCDLLINAATCL